MQQLMSNDEAARLARSQQISKQIDELKSPKDNELREELNEAKLPRPESPRNFINRRMRELEQDNNSDQSSNL
jgi:hypothetical protein